MSFEELKDFVSQVQNLPCLIKEVNAIDKLMAQVESFRYEAKLVLTSEDYNESRVHELLEHAETLDLDLPEIAELKLVSFVFQFLPSQVFSETFNLLWKWQSGKFIFEISVSRKRKLEMQYFVEVIVQLVKSE